MFGVKRWAPPLASSRAPVILSSLSVILSGAKDLLLTSLLLLTLLLTSSWKDLLLTFSLTYSVGAIAFA